MGGGEVLKKGWLVKSPPLESGGMKSWRKRYFLLRSSKILEYYKSENGDIKGVVNLEDCVSVHSDLFHKKYKHVFDIQTRDRTYYLVAPSMDDMTCWVTALCSLCDFTTQDSITRNPRSASTLPMSVVKTPLPLEPSTTRFSPEMQKYLLSPEVVDLLRNKPPEDTTVPAGLPLQEALIQKGLASHTHSHTFSYPNSTRTSTASSVESLGVFSHRSSQDTDHCYSQESVDYTPPSHYDVPPRSYNRAQLLSNNYMVPRLARMSDPLYNYDTLPPPRPADGGHTHYDYLPKRDIPLPPRSDDMGGASIYDVPPPPRPLIDTPTMDTPTMDMPTMDTPSSRSHSIDSTDCPPLLPPPQIIFRRDSKTSDSEMIPNKMYDMVWTGQEEFSLLPPHEFEETLTDKTHRPYVNLCVDDTPPPVNRALKPGVAPPIIDRARKPGDRRTSIEDAFHPRELPRLTSHSVHYTQVSFDRKKPVPTPRTNRTPTASPQRVNYCHIDITATNAPAINEQSPKESIDSNSL